MISGSGSKGAYNKKYYVENRDAIRAYQRKWRLANAEKVRASSRKWQAANLERHREKGRRYARRGLPTPTRPMPELCERGCGHKASCLDHCHATNVFRGWLCKSCNAGIGMLGDTVKDLIEATDYLKRGDDE